MLNKELKILYTTLEILKKSNLVFWVTNGTLLGLIREQRILPWDKDLDIGILNSTNKDKIIDLFLKEGYTLMDYGLHSDYVVFEFKNTEIDFNFFNERNDIFQSLWRVAKNSKVLALIRFFLDFVNLDSSSFKFLWTNKGYGINKQDLFPLKIKFILNQSFIIPNNPENVLEFLYGTNWQTPNINYNWMIDSPNLQKD